MCATGLPTSPGAVPRVLPVLPRPYKLLTFYYTFVLVFVK